MNFSHHFFDGLEGSCGYAHTNTVNGHGLQVYVLAAFRRNIRMASGMAEVRFFVCEFADAGHIREKGY